MSVSQSLLEPQTGSSLASAANWIAGVLAGPLATSLCIIAVAALGMLMLTGRLPIRRGIAVVLGCFLIFGASSIAGGLRGLGGDAASGPPVQLVIERETPPPLPPANYDPYAGASLRRW